MYYKNIDLAYYKNLCSAYNTPNVLKKYRFGVL